MHECSRARAPTWISLIACKGMAAAASSGSSSSSFSLAADEGGKALKVFHASNVAAAILLPVAAFSDSGSAVQTAANWAIAGVLPLHGHIGMNWVITDYIPPASQGSVRALTLAASVICFLGLARVNAQGDGVIDTVKHLWTPLKVADEEEAAAGAH